jgi:hypothetical protein
MRDKNQPTKKAGHKKPHMYTKRLGKLSPIGIILAACFIVGAVLLGIQASYLVIKQQNIQTEGATFEVYWDGEQLTTSTYNAPEDQFTDNKLIPGETETFTHTVSSPITDGNWEFYWNNEADMTWFHTPLHEFYGYYFRTTDNANQDINNMVVMHGENKTIKFIHSLDTHFQYTANPIPFKLQLHICPFVQAPEANDDNYGFPMGTTDVVLHVLENDLDYSGGLNITSTSQGTISPDGQTILFVGHADLHTSLVYTITDNGPRHKTDTATVTLAFN